MTAQVSHLHIIRQAVLRAEPWKNGGGVTRVIWSQTRGDTLLWRLSLADVTADGPFSVFDGMTRVLSVVQGAGMDLRGAEQTFAAEPYQPVQFAGDTPLDGLLRDGKVVNLNLIHDAADIRSVVTPVHGPCPVSASHPAAVRVIHCVTGQITFAGSQALGPGDTAIALSEADMSSGHCSGICIVMALSDQSDASSPFIAPR